MNERSRFLAIFLAGLVLCMATAVSANDLSLTPPPIRAAKTAQAGMLAFPADSAGITAYVKVEQTIDLEKIKSIFGEVEEVADNYILGQLSIANTGGNITVYVYADTEGWLAAFLKRSEPTSRIMQWEGIRGETIPRTTLTDALLRAANSTDLLFLPEIDFYHFIYPKATSLTIFTGSSAKVAIPENYMLYETSYYHYVRNGSSDLTVDGVLVSTVGASYNQVNMATKLYVGTASLKQVLTPGPLHAVNLTSVRSNSNYNHSAGVASVILYRTGE